MRIKDIIPKNLVLGQIIDDFADATTKVNYDIEDLCCYVINNINCYYWLNIESVWGPLGFVWNTINDYGHFNTNNIEFNKIPSVPDGDRIKQFYNTFNKLDRNIEVYKSNWENVTQFYSSRDEIYGVFIFNSDYKIPLIDLAYPDFTAVDNKSGYLFKFVLNETTIGCSPYECYFILDNESYKYYPFKQMDNSENMRYIIFNVYEDITNPFTLCINQFRPNSINIKNNINEFHFNIDYIDGDDDNYYKFTFGSSDIASTCTFYFYGINSNKDGVFWVIADYAVKDVILVNIDNIRDRSIYYTIFNIRTTKHYWYDIDKRIYNKLNNYLYYKIQFDNETELTSCTYNFNLNNYTYIWVNGISLLDDYKTTYSTIDTNNRPTYYNFNFFPNYEYFATKNFINDINIYDYTTRNYYNNIVLYISDKEVTVKYLYLFDNDNVKKVYGIDRSYFYRCSNAQTNQRFYNNVDIRKKEYVVLSGNFNLRCNDSDYGSCENCLTGIYNSNNDITYFNVDEVKPFDITRYTKINIKNYHVDYLGIYLLDNALFTVTQPLIVSGVNEIFNSELRYSIYLNEDIFAQLNNCEIKYIYKCKLVVNKNSVLTNDKFVEIINAYIFDNNINSAKGITLEIYTDYFNLIPEDKIQQFINDGYIINENIN